jgi:hypothetical protein
VARVHDVDDVSFDIYRGETLELDGPLHTPPHRAHGGRSGSRSSASRRSTRSPSARCGGRRDRSGP